LSAVKLELTVMAPVLMMGLVGLGVEVPGQLGLVEVPMGELGGLSKVGCRKPKDSSSLAAFSSSSSKFFLSSSACLAEPSDEEAEEEEEELSAKT
jgi:hypothetical protein